MLRSLTTVLALSAGAAVAGPLDPSRVIPGAAFVIHVNVEQAARGPIGKLVEEHKAELDMEDLDEVRQFGVDPFKDVLSVTVSAPTTDTEAGVIVVETTDAVDGLVEHLKAESGAEATNIEGREVFSFKDGDDSKHACIRRNEKSNTRIIYLSDSLESLVSMLKGGEPVRLPLTDAAPGSVVSVQIVDLAGIVEHAPKKDAGPMAMLSNIRSGWLDVGTKEEQLFLKGSVRCAAEEGAVDLRDMLRGFVAMGRQLGKGNEELASLSTLVSAVSVDAAGEEVKVDASWPLTDLVHAIQQLDKHDSDDEGDEEADDDEEAAPRKNPHEVIRKEKVQKIEKE